jgi:hypothetical protein
MWSTMGALAACRRPPPRNLLPSRHCDGHGNPLPVVPVHFVPYDGGYDRRPLALSSPAIAARQSLLDDERDGGRPDGGAAAVSKASISFSQVAKSQAKPSQAKPSSQANSHSIPLLLSESSIPIFAMSATTYSLEVRKRTAAGSNPFAATAAMGLLAGFSLARRPAMIVLACILTNF